MGELKEAAAVYRSFISRDPQSGRANQARALLNQVEAALAKQEEAQLPKAPEPQPAPALGTAVIPAPPPATEELHLVEPPTPAPAQSRPPRRPAPRRSKQCRPHAGRVRECKRLCPAARLYLGRRRRRRNRDRRRRGARGVPESSLSDSLHSSAEVQSLQLQEASDAHRANSFFVAGGALAAIAVACFVLRF